MAAIVVVIMIFVDCGLWNYMRGKKRKRSGVKNGGKKKRIVDYSSATSKR